MSVLSDEARPLLRYVGIFLMVAGGAVAGYVARLAQDQNAVSEPKIESLDRFAIPVLPAPTCTCPKGP